MAGDASALAGDWLLRDLDQDFLPLLQQFADDRQVRGLNSGAAPSVPASLLVSSAAPVETATFAAVRCRGFRPGGSLLIRLGSWLVEIFFLFGSGLLFGLGEAHFGLVRLLFGFGRRGVAEAAVDVHVANGVFHRGSPVERLFLHLLGRVLLRFGEDGLEVVLVLVDGLFLKNAHSRLVSKKLTHYVSFRRG